MKYFMGSQVVPGKGQAEMHYECDDALTVLRTLTFITGTAAVERNSDPVIKRLYKPERLAETNGSRFQELWNAGS